MNCRYEQHRWILGRDCGFRFLIRHLWTYLSADVRRQARAPMVNFVTVCFQCYFVASDGAVRLYPVAGYADLYGAVEVIGVADYTDALAPEK